MWLIFTVPCYSWRGTFFAEQFLNLYFQNSVIHTWNRALLLKHAKKS